MKQGPFGCAPLAPAKNNGQRGGAGDMGLWQLLYTTAGAPPNRAAQNALYY